MIQKLTITKVFSTNIKKDGKPLINKNGKPYFRVGIQTNEYGVQWLNGFLFNDGKDLQGKTVELNVTEEEYQGKIQLRFAFPRKEDKLEAEITEIRRILNNVCQFVGYSEYGKKDASWQQTEGNGGILEDYQDENLPRF